MPWRYRDGSECVACTHRQIEDFRYYGKQGMPGAPDPFPQTAAEAVACGMTFWYGPACPRGPHMREVPVGGGRCLVCRYGPQEVRGGSRATPNSYRKIAAGADGRETPCSRMARALPELVIDRRTAAALGMTLYRTGAPCHRGHTGYRFVSTGNCCECRRER